MPLEIEAKMRLRDRAGLEARLLAAGAQRGLSVLEEDAFFDTPERSLKAGDCGLRLRHEAQVDGPYRRAILTHKGPLVPGQFKTRPETEIQVSDAAAAEQLLHALGFEPTLTFQKRRDRWELDGCHVELDRLPHLGEFVEIEGPTEDAVLMVRKKLELESEPLIRKGYISMLADYLVEHGIRTTRVELSGS